MRRSCEYYDVMCSLPPSRCYEDCPYERSFKAPDIDDYAYYMDYDDNQGGGSCMWDGTCDNCPFVSDCPVNHD